MPISQFKFLIKEAITFRMEENRLKQTRMSFSNQSSQIEERFVRPIVEDEAVIKDEKHGTAIAAAALAIYKREQAVLLNLQKMKEGGHNVSSNTETVRRKEERISRKPSYGGSWKKKSFREDHEKQFPVRLSSAGKSPIGRERSYQKHKESYTPMDTVNSRAESWKMAKIQKRYKKIKFKILQWEGEKKMQAVLQKDRMKNELEQKRAMTMLNYQNKIATIHRIAQRARAKLEDKRRKEESKVKEKTNRIIKTGRLPVKCFIFKFLMCRK